MISIKTTEQLDKMKEGGKISSRAVKEVLDYLKPGIKTIELDRIAEKYILSQGGKPSFKTVHGYSYTTCININEGIVHGLPNNYKIKRGDIVSIDLGVYYKGFHTDISYTLEVETQKEKDFLDTGKKALTEAISKCVEGFTLGDIGFVIQSIVESQKYTVSRELVGHGIGKELHESPYVPGYGKRGHGPKLKEGMVFAIEVIYQKGKPDLALDKDGWTLITKDRSLSALFEHTVIVGKNSPLVITDSLFT